MFRRSVCGLLSLVVLCSLAGCQPAEKDISCQDVVAAYEAAGYTVWHNETTAEDCAWTCSVTVNGKDSDDYIYFHFFESSEAAQAYADTQQWNVVLWLYTLALFQPTWLTTKTYGNIEYEYCDSGLIRPFNELLRSP